MQISKCPKTYKEVNGNSECVVFIMFKQVHVSNLNFDQISEFPEIHGMGWLRLVGSLKLQVSLAEYRLFYRALLQKRPMISRSLLIVATPYSFKRISKRSRLSVCACMQQAPSNYRALLQKRPMILRSLLHTGTNTQQRSFQAFQCDVTQHPLPPCE